METKPSSARRHILYAVFLGLAFPLAATIVDLVAQNSRLTLANVWQVQARSYLHWMIDLVPAFLGLLAGLSARRKNRLSQENTKLAREIQERTAAIRDLGALRADLEREVDAQALELTRCSDFLEVTAQVSRAAASTPEPALLTQTVVDILHTHFGLYFAGLFLVDEAFEWAVLHAGSGDAGRRMLACGHRVRIGEGPVGRCITRGEPRVASWSETDTERVDAQELPQTRSEAALPLHSRGAVLGALTIHATQSGAFDAAFVSLLQTIADRVAVSLDNARLSAQNREAVEAAQRAQAELSGHLWGRYLQTQHTLAFRSDASGVKRLADEDTRQIETGSSDGSRDGNRLAVPITIRGHTIGTLETYRPAADGAWSQEELRLLQQLVEQLGLALEDARLYENAQRRAQREQLVASISDKIRAAPDIDGILRVAVQEIRRALGVSYGAIRLGTETHLRPPQQARATPATAAGSTDTDRDHYE